MSWFLASPICVLGRTRIVSIVVSAVCLLAGAALAQSPVSLTINNSPGPVVAPDFGVFSFETGSLQYNNQSYAPNAYFFNPTNAQLITLFQNLGVKSVRIGGDSVDGSYIPSDSDIDSFFGFAQAADVKAIFSLDLLHGTPSEDASEAQYIQDNYATNVICLAIGNEPTDYDGEDGITNFSSYFAIWQSFASAVIGAVPDVKLGGTDNDNHSGGISWAADFAEAEQGSTNVVSILYHYKPGGSANRKTTQQLINGMLSSSWDTSDYPSCYSSVGVPAQSYGLSYRISEFNAYLAPTNSVQGEYTPFSSALFALDVMHWWAANGCLGLHFHTGDQGFQAAFYIDTNGNYQVYPICYGIEAFNVGGYGNVEPLTMTNTDALNLTAYAVGNGTNLYVTIVNKENGTGASNAAVTITPSGFAAGNVAAMFLVQSNGDVMATNGVTFGGASISGTGPWLGQWTALGSLTNGRCTVAVPASSATVVRIQATALAPPMIVQDLPLQVLLVPNETYQYSIGTGGGWPLSYQWYHGETRVAGQTNATYMVTAGSLGSRTTYFVVITNISGSVTSSVSTLTVIAPPTNSFATTIQQFNPVGYWPMHEVEAAARGDIETNCGTLGLLGTGYYPDWASGSPAGLVRGYSSGPLSNDTTACVNFLHTITSGSGFADAEYINFLFLPHSSPLTTLNPPFSVECWVDITNTSAGEEIWGQFGFDSLNGAGTASAPFGYGVSLNWNGGLFPDFYNGSAQDELDSGTASSDQWYYAVVTCSSATNTFLYLNGNATGAGQSAAGKYFPDSWTPLTIGGGRGGTRAYGGHLADFAIYTNVLSAMDISNKYNIATNANSVNGEYADAVLNDNPVVFYRMDAPATYTPPATASLPVLHNYATNGLAGGNGVYTAGTVPGIMPGPVNNNGVPYGGVSTNTVMLSGVSSFGDAGFAPAYNPTGSNANFTVTAIFRGYPCDGRFESIVGHGTNSWQLGMSTNGVLVFNAGNGNGAAGGTGQAPGDITTTGVYNDGHWHQVVAVNSTNVISIYVDGKLDTSGTPAGIATTNVIPGNTSDVLIGSDPTYTNNPAGVGRSFAGQICDVAFFTNALTFGQVESLYLSASTPLPETLTLTNTGAGKLQLNWTYGTLQTATNVTGPYSDIQNASPPYTIPTTNSQQFYRVREN